MNADQDTLRKIANLARLDLKESDEVEILNDLNRILTWVEKLSEIDTSNVEPLTHINTDLNVMREDIISETLPRSKALENAPKQDGEHFRVPKVIE
ncbi:Asp-tRNA(Asn)/Glu-tRNA(Gln) amidotransferase subunit GatC [Cytophagaceae bacterium DM2B3-1]|uniref:Aspartyl/glutamyl-tRNA(Asn/Gln) amidotransferase subunit C n=1 Tax=Xanthocytophaga flava TaxID=3048013 RepID=A0ABT7CPL0_9BACT|nr:Asp-tRNA(Asn)/Glu-tRNA(Gln) amidotransferase subunit GatC [Xanthocytophaga flavus]MDJ1468819.1 Asp-tRNA(Asn)/Glu-tRNA(Gln) amidotransferase subunit GatC [Xanthocytophaga flavus]MDJ1495679.1 Asp-tRNA(Asn)/Glu-tRNA(Gln) amidotransferase subunit GatC [Xanthocytophaga flavus]